MNYKIASEEIIFLNWIEAFYSKKLIDVITCVHKSKQI